MRANCLRTCSFMMIPGAIVIQSCSTTSSLISCCFIGMSKRHLFSSYTSSFAPKDVTGVSKFLIQRLMTLIPSLALPIYVDESCNIRRSSQLSVPWVKAGKKIKVKYQWITLLRGLNHLTKI